MSRFSSFVFGLLLGGAAVFVGLKYHVVRAEDGLHLIPKQTAQLKDAYVDIRQFGVKEWSENPDLAAAILRADKPELLKDAARGVLEDTVDGLLEKIDTLRPN